MPKLGEFSKEMKTCFRDMIVITNLIIVFKFGQISMIGLNDVENEVDYDNRKQNYRDIDIFLNSTDVRNIVLVQVKNFIAAVDGKPIENKPLKELPSAVKEQVVDNLDFDELEFS